jgi:hypothetical protein
VVRVRAVAFRRAMPSAWTSLKGKVPTCFAMGMIGQFWLSSEQEGREGPVTGIGCTVLARTGCSVKWPPSIWSSHGKSAAFWCVEYMVGSP